MIKVNWNKTTILYTIIVALVIVIVLLLVQRGSGTKPNKTDTSFQDSLVSVNNKLRDSLMKDNKAYILLEQRHYREIDSLTNAILAQENRIKQRQKEYEKKINAIRDYNSSELTRAYSEFR